MGASAFKDVSQVGERVDASIVRSWQTRLRKLFKLANVSNSHAHRFRDTFTVELLLAGVPIERVSILLGHQSVRITEKHYAPWVRSRQEQLEADLANAWSRDPLVLLQSGVHQRYTPSGAPTTHLSSISKDWCPGWESNPHEEKSPEDFKSSASAIPPPGRWLYKSNQQKRVLQHGCSFHSSRCRCFQSGLLKQLPLTFRWFPV